MAKWLIFCSFIFCLSMTLLGLVIDLTYQLHYKPQLENWQNQIQSGYESYEKHRVYFSNSSVLSKKPFEGKDFADYLRSRVNSQKNHVLINPQLLKSTMGLGDKWLDKRHLIKPSALVQEVFNRIESFSHWNVSKTLALNPKMEATEFIVASQIYVANSLYTHPEDLVKTLEKVRHMAFLLLGSEVLNFKLAGLSLFEKERDLIEFLKNRRMVLNGTWELVPTEELDKYRRFLFQTYNFLTFLTKPKLLDDLYVRQDLPVGFCSVYKERKPFLDWISTFLNQQFPFEPSFRQHLKVMARIDQKAHRECGSLKKKSEAPPSPFTSQIPYYRRILAIKILLTKQSLGEGS